jgi:hypothetical protein
MRVRRDKRVSWRSPWTVRDSVEQRNPATRSPHSALHLQHIRDGSHFQRGAPVLCQVALQAYAEERAGLDGQREPLPRSRARHSCRVRPQPVRRSFVRTGVCAKTDGMCAVTFRTLERLRPSWRRPRLSSRLTSTRTRTSVSIRRPLGPYQCNNTPRCAAPMSPGGTKWCVLVLCAAHTFLTLHFRERNLPVGRRFVVPRRYSLHSSLRFNVRSTTLPRTRSTSLQGEYRAMAVLQSVYSRKATTLTLKFLISVLRAQHTVQATPAF